MRWITREGVKVDRTACAWVILRFIDERAEFHFAPKDKVTEKAEKLNAVPFDVPDVRFGHHGGKCSFDAIIEGYGFKDVAMLMMADIVRGADVDMPDPPPESAGLMAIVLGVAVERPSDAARIDLMLPLYDALYAYCKEKAGKRL